MGNLVTSIEIGRILFQSGYGTPTHMSKIGSKYTNLNTGEEYVNRNGQASWLVNVTSSGTSSLSGATLDYVLQNGNSANDQEILNVKSLELLEQVGIPSVSLNAMKLQAEDKHGKTILNAYNSSGFLGRMFRDSKIIVRNTTGTLITKGKALTISGATGNVANVTLASKSSESTLRGVTLAFEDIQPNEFGFALRAGVLENFDTSAFLEGMDVYVDLNGNITTTKPIFPNFIVKVGTILVSGVGNGQIEIDVETVLEAPSITPNSLALPRADSNSKLDSWVTPSLHLTGGTVTGDVKIAANLEVLGNLTVLDTQTVQTSDNNIVLNYSGTNTSAIGGGITLEDGISNGNNITFLSDSSGNMNLNTGLNVNGATAIRQVNIKQNTATVSIGSLIGATDFGSIYINQTTPSISNYTLASYGNNALLNATSFVDLRINNTTKLNITDTKITSKIPLKVEGGSGLYVNTFDGVGTGTGSVGAKLTNLDKSGRTIIYLNELDDTSTPFFIQRLGSTHASLPNLCEIGATGDFRIRTSASFLERMRIKSDGNITINEATPTRILSIKQDTATTSIGSLNGATGYAGLYFNQTTPSTTNYAICGTSSLTFLNATTSLSMRIGNTLQLAITSGKADFSASIVSRAGTTAAGTAPIKLVAGPLMTTPEDGAMEYDGTNLYFTIGSTRKLVNLT